MQQAHDLAIIGLRRYDGVGDKAGAGSKNFSALQNGLLAIDNVKALGIVGAPHGRQSALCDALRERPQSDRDRRTEPRATPR